MRAPKCLKCGGEHWSREGCPEKAAGLKTVAVLEVEPHEIGGVKFGSHVVIQEFPKVEKPADYPRGGISATALSPEAEKLRLELERVSGLKVRLFDPAKTRAYNRVYMADRRAGKKPRKNGGK